MRKIIPFSVLLLLVVATVPSYGAITFVNSCTGGSATGNTFTTAACDMTGVNLLVACSTSNFAAGGEGAISDSSTNAWSAGEGIIHGGGTTITRVSYVAVPTVTAAQTFTMTCTDCRPSVTVLGFSGALAVSPYDQHNDGENTASTIQYTTMTPSEDNEVIVACLGDTAETNVPTINGGFSSPVGQQFVSGQHQGGYGAYLIQTTAAANTATWSNVTGDIATVNTIVQASFKAAAVVAGGGSGGLLLMGVGQ